MQVWNPDEIFQEERLYDNSLVCASKEYEPLLINVSGHPLKNICKARLAKTLC